MRTVKEWIGASDDTKAPPRVRQRVFDREGGKCHICQLKIENKKWALDHVQALINGGENRETNLRPVHVKCHAEKTAEDVRLKAKVAQVRGKHTGAIRPKQTIKSAGFPKASKPASKPLPPRRSLYVIGQLLPASSNPEISDAE
jgi:5-methylcytosine-specific restriction protein A